MHQAGLSDFQLRRSLFAVPASSEKMIEKAKNFLVDQVFLDLEDAVAPEAKSQARQLIAALNGDDFKAPIVSIRINAIDTPWIKEDIDLLK